MFRVLIILAVAIPAWFVGTIWFDRKNKQWDWISKDSRDMYAKVLEIVIGASAVAVSLVAAIVSKGELRSQPVLHSVKFSVVSLIACMVFGLLAILSLSRGYDRAQARYVQTRPKTKYFDRGRLDDFEFNCILITSCFCLVGFLVGFLFLARVVFQI